MVSYNVLACVVSLPLIGYIALISYLKHTRRKCISTADLTGKVVIITGANCGIGYETALDFARRNGKIVLACRSKERGERAADQIRKQTGNGNVVCKICDISSLSSVRKFVEEFLKEETRLDILINNAGVSGIPLTTTEDGLELTWASNYFGHFLLTNLLLDTLKTSAPSRIINVSSAVHKQGWIDFENFNGKKGYLPGLFYNHTKLAQILFTRKLAKKLQQNGVTVNSLHPGIVQTNVMRHFKVGRKIFDLLGSTGLLKTAEEGAQTTIYCAVAEELPDITGRYFDNCRLANESEKAKNDDTASKLWEVSEQMVGLKFESNNINMTDSNCELT